MDIEAGKSFPKVIWPDGKRFAFTIFDDTDHSTVSNVGEVYAFLKKLGFRTTKSVWPVQGRTQLVGDEYKGASCDEPKYLDWVKSLKQDGFEIGFHSTTFHRSTRDQIIIGLNRFKDLFGDNPRSMSQHSDSTDCESIYWGPDRVSGVYALLFNLLTLYRSKSIYRGHIEGDEYFFRAIKECLDAVVFFSLGVLPDFQTGVKVFY